MRKRRLCRMLSIVATQIQDPSRRMLILESHFSLRQTISSIGTSIIMQPVYGEVFCRVHMEQETYVPVCPLAFIRRWSRTMLLNVCLRNHQLLKSQVKRES